MKTLEKLKLQNLMEICKQEQKTLLGGSGSEPIYGSMTMLDTVYCYGYRTQCPPFASYYDPYYSGYVPGSASSPYGSGGYAYGVSAAGIAVTSPSVIPSLELMQMRAQACVDLCRSYLGTEELAGENDNQRILEFFACTTFGNTHDETAWCSAFVNFVMESTGREYTNSAKASSWNRWGAETSNPSIGDVAIRSDGHHVGIVSAIDTDGAIHIISGNSNQDNSPGKVAESIVSADNYSFRTDH